MTVVVLGGGSTGEAFAGALRGYEPETPITLIERELVGGECSYFACMPSKALLRPGEARAESMRVPGAAEAVTGPLDRDRVFWHRDQVTDDGDDTSQAKWLADRRIELVRGDGRICRPGVIEVAGDELPYERLLIATGSRPAVPPIDGLEELDFWTNREATAGREIPESLVVIGAGPVGCELAQFYRRMGSAVTVVDSAPRLLPRDPSDAGAMLAEAFAEDGIELRLGAGIVSVGEGVLVHLQGGETLRAERLLVAAGRQPNITGLGCENLGLQLSDRGIEVDNRLRAGPGVWAAGDVTGIAMFTHVGKYQARVAAADCAGRPARVDYTAIPAVTFTDPQVASVGNTSGEGLLVGERRSVARLSTYERPARPMLLRVYAERRGRTLVGALAVGPEAGEWLGQLTLAIRAQVPVHVIADTIQPYPTFSEAVHFAVADLGQST